MLDYSMSDKETDASGPETVNDRRFRRYHRAAARRRKAEKSDTYFYRAVFSVAGVGAAFAIGLAVFVLTGGDSLSGMETLAAPWIGNMSRLEVFGIGFIVFLGALFLWRVRKR